jgi:hypothetical protein
MHADTVHDILLYAVCLKLALQRVIDSLVCM